MDPTFLRSKWLFVAPILAMSALESFLGYSWLINTRGYASIKPAKDDVVLGGNIQPESKRC